jgi:hypothetical protein
MRNDKPDQEYVSRWVKKEQNRKNRFTVLHCSWTA